METLEQLRDRLVARFPEAQATLVTNPGAAAQHTLLLANHAAVPAVAAWLRDDAALRLDYCSNVTGVDWPEKEVTETVKAEVVQADGTTKVVEQKAKRVQPGFLEVVYHLYSMALKQGPVILRLRTADRRDAVTVPSLTPVWRACEFQEREVFDLYGVVFTGHPDLRRILMWDGFVGHPMRKDYVSPDDFEWEPTPHDEVLTRARAHYPAKSTPSIAGGAS